MKYKLDQHISFSFNQITLCSVSEGNNARLWSLIGFLGDAFLILMLQLLPKNLRINKTKKKEKQTAGTS